MGSLDKSQTQELGTLPYRNQVILEPSSRPASLFGTIFDAAKYFASYNPGPEYLSACDIKHLS
jgi:hypothetical protein